jgi:hypothetical protein
MFRLDMASVKRSEGDGDGEAAAGGQAGDSPDHRWRRRSGPSLPGADAQADDEHGSPVSAVAAWFPCSCSSFRLLRLKQRDNALLERFPPSPDFVAVLFLGLRDMAGQDQTSAN